MEALHYTGQVRKSVQVYAHTAEHALVLVAETLETQGTVVGSRNQEWTDFSRGPKAYSNGSKVVEILHRLLGFVGRVCLKYVYK